MQFNNRKSGVAIHLIIVKLKTTNTLRDDLIYNNQLVYHCKKLTPTTRGRPQVSPTIEGVNFFISLKIYFFNNKINNIVIDAIPTKTQVIKTIIKSLFPACINLLPKLNHKLKLLIIVKTHKNIIAFLFSNIFTLSPILIFC